MERIAIVGCGGSGKTRLARQASARLGIPAVHLDAIYYDAGWSTLPAGDFAATQRELVATRTWIVDGNYASTLPIRLTAADTVVFLDLPAVTCLLGIVQRRLRSGRGGQRRATGEFDRITAEFVNYVWQYRRSMRPRVLRSIADHAGDATVVVLPSRRAARRWLDTLPHADAGAGADRR